MITELNVQDDESSDSDDEYDKSCLLWGLGGCFLSTFGMALTAATLIAKDSLQKEISLKIAVGIVMITVGASFCGTGVLLAKYGSFPSREPIATINDSSEDANELTPFVGIENRI